MKLTTTSTTTLAFLLFLFDRPHHLLVAAESDKRELSSSSNRQLALFNAFNVYGQPNPSVSKIDIDQRSIVASTALSSTVGLKQTKTNYEEGGLGFKTLKALIMDDDVYKGYDLYQKAVVFYGGDEYYGDTWMQAAFGGDDVYLGDNLFSMSRLDLEGRSTAIRWGTLVFNVLLGGVMSYMHRAVRTCEASPSNALQDWDYAFSYYTGSLAESDFPVGGYLLYNLVQLYSEVFGTTQKDQESPINTEILEFFVDSRNQIADNQCDELDGLQRIMGLLVVPLIQGCLKAVYAMDLEDDSRQITQGEAAAFSSAMIPILGGLCGSKGNAQIVYNDLSPGNGPSGSFEVVKGAFEHSYDCLGITCADVGGIVSYDGTYHKRAEACKNVQPVKGAGEYPSKGSGNNSSSSPKTTNSSTEKTNAGLALGITFGILFTFLIGIGIRCLLVRSKRRSRQNTLGPEKGLEDKTDDPELI